MLALILAVALFAGLAITSTFCNVVIEHHRVKNAVDAAALAGAQDLLVGAKQACHAVSETAQTNHVVVDECVSADQDVVVRVSTQLSLFGRSYIVRESARAGYE